MQYTEYNAQFFLAVVGMYFNEAGYPGTPLLVFSPTTEVQELKSSLNS